MKTFTLLVVFSSFTGTVFAQSKDRLLPSNEANAISVQVKQDNQALNLTIKNDSSMVLTSGKLRCSLTGEDAFFTDFNGSRLYQLSPVHQSEINIRILPSNNAEHYIELEDQRKVECRINEPRGREKKFYELM